MIKKVFVDTNVIIDLLAKREPFYEAAAKIFSLADMRRCTAAVDERTVRQSLSTTSRFRDIEDAMQHYAVVHSECEAIITRNVKDFKQADIPVFSPDEFLKEF